MHGPAKLLLVLLLWSVLANGQVTLYQQNFDSLPSESSQAPPIPVQSSDLHYSYITNAASHTSPNSAVATGASTVTIPIPTSNYNNISLSFESYCTSLSSGGCSYIEYTIDGFTWNTVLTYCHGEGDTSVWSQTTTPLPTSANNNPIFAFRLRAVITGTGKTYLDNIVVTGLSGVGPGVSKNGIVSRQVLTSALLTGSTCPTAPVATSEFYLPPTGAPVSSSPGKNFLQGTITLGTAGSTLAVGSHYNTLVDWYSYMQGSYEQSNQMLYLPSFTFNFFTAVIGGITHVVPVQRGLNANTHPHWEWVLAPGRMWYETGDGSNTRVAIPVSLTQRNANCVHNGMLTFVFNSGTLTSAPPTPTSAYISNAFLQITAETCDYFQINYWGLYDATLILSSISNVASLQSNYIAEVNGRLPLRPFYMLPLDNPSANLNSYNFGNNVTQSAVSFYALSGWQYNSADVVYYSPGYTRFGSYPWAESFIVPSYSLAKSFLVSLSVQSLIESQGTAFLSTALSTVCPSYDSGGTLLNAISMATGYYSTTGYLVDENSLATSDSFFLVNTNYTKLYQGDSNGTPSKPDLGTACGYPYQKNTPPGTQWVYHTSDFYMATRIIENNLPASYGFNISKYWNAVIAGPLGLSPLIQSPRTTYDDGSTPKTWGAWGVFFTVDDIAKISNFLNKEEGVSGSQILSPTYLSRAMQRDSSNQGLTIPNLGSTANPYLSSNPFTYRYNLGFWAANVFDGTLSAPNFFDYMPSGGYPCTTAANTPAGDSTALSQTYTPYFLGYGGITVSLLPNRINFMIFSDSDLFVWAPAARETVKLMNFCQSGLY